MTARERAIMTTAVSILLMEMVLPLPIPFLSTIVLGLVANFLSFTNIARTIALATFMFGVLGGLKFGIFGFIFYVLTYSMGCCVITPFAYFTFKTLKVRERLGL